MSTIILFKQFKIDFIFMCKWEFCGVQPVPWNSHLFPLCFCDNEKKNNWSAEPFFQSAPVQATKNCHWSWQPRKKVFATCRRKSFSLSKFPHFWRTFKIKYNVLSEIFIQKSRKLPNPTYIFYETRKRLLFVFLFLISIFS